MAVSRRSGRRSILYADHELIQVSSNQATGIPSVGYTTPLGLIGGIRRMVKWSPFGGLFFVYHWEVTEGDWNVLWPA